MATEVEQHIQIETEAGIGWIRFNRPEKMNAIGALTRKQLGDAIKQAERDDAVRVVVLAGSGRAFSSGADVTEMVQGQGRAPDGGVSWLLPRLAGTGVAYEMFFSGKPLSATDAHRLGVINRLVPADRLEEEVRDLANQLAAQPRQAMAGAKRAVNHALTSSYEEAMEFESYLQEAQAGSSEFAEGVQSFLARRKK